MEQTIAMQSITRSRFDHSKICTVYQETAQFPTRALIHPDARFLHICSGKGELRLQGQCYELQPDQLLAILPWQISEITQVRETLQYDVIVYHFDTLCAAIHLFLDTKGNPYAMQGQITKKPSVQLGMQGKREIAYLMDMLRQELGMMDVMQSKEEKPYASIRTLSLLTQLMVLFLRQDAQSAPAQAQMDYREVLRYMYLHCNEKITLQELASQFYCSKSTISAHITAMTGLSFFDLLNEMRIGKTANYLLYTDMTLKEMAEVLGYVDESHISKVFAARLGTKIGEYRKTYQKVENICRIEETRLAYTIVNYIYRNYSSDLSAKNVAQAFGVSAVRLNELLIYQIERNFEEYLNYIRVNRACELLIETKLTVLEIALEVGYHTSKTLTRSFLKQRQITPSAFRALRQTKN